MSAMASQITSLTIVYSTTYSGTDQRKHQSSASLAFVRGIHRRTVNSPHKGPRGKCFHLMTSSWCCPEMLPGYVTEMTDKTLQGLSVQLNAIKKSERFSMAVCRQKYNGLSERPAEADSVKRGLALAGFLSVVLRQRSLDTRFSVVGAALLPSSSGVTTCVTNWSSHRNSQIKNINYPGARTGIF